MTDSIQMVITMKKNDNPCEIVLKLKNEFIETLGEQHRTQFNKYLIFAIFGETLGEIGLKQTLLLLEELKETAKNIHKQSLH